MAKEAKDKKQRSPRNYELKPGTGLMRFSRAKMAAKKRFYRKRDLKATPAVKPKAELFKIKQIGGDKNGGQRKVLIKKGPSLIAVERKRIFRTHKSHRPFKNHPRRLKKSLTPGTVVIVLVGPHKGKRAVFLKQLASGLLLITGPYRFNGLPLRRINQIYVIGTKTKIDISQLKVPDNVNDQYFKRAKRGKKKTAEADIFASKKAEYAVSDQRKQDQKTVDKALISIIKKNANKTDLRGYLSSHFELKKNQFPHRMTF